MIKDFGRLMVGLLLLSIGIVMGIQANLGVSPWDVLHIGITNYIDLSLGQINIIVGAIVVLISMKLGQFPGIATLLNISLIGIMLDVVMNYEIIPQGQGGWDSIFLLLCGIYLNGWGTAIYLSVGWGSGPRDSMLLALMHKTGFPIAKIKAIVEISVLAIGFFLGGPVGIGTVVLAIAVGYVVQHGFKVMKIKPTEIVHKTIKDLREYKGETQNKKRSENGVENSEVGI